MKANELMIGDWVVYQGDTEYTNPIKIEGMDIATDMLITSDREDVGLNGVEPIPLTEEILEQNGFVRHDKHEYSVTGSNYNYLKVRCYADTYFEIGNAFDEEGELQAFADIQHVHELQHALKLCGIDKEIEL